MDVSAFARFDPHHIQEIGGGDREFVKEMLQLFQQESDEKLPILLQSLSNGDEKNSVLYSHDTKGSSATIGALRVRAVAEKMEFLSKEKKFQEALGYFDQLKEELIAVYKEFDKASSWLYRSSTSSFGLC